MKRIKVLHASIKAGGGHNALRDFIYNELEKQPDKFRNIKFDHTVDSIEAFDTALSKVAPALYELFFFFAPRTVSDVFFVATFNLFKQCYRAIKDNNPDIILSSHFLLTQHFSLAKRLLRSKTIVVDCMPDYGPPSALQNPTLPWFRAEYILTFEEWTKNSVIKDLKVPKEKVLLAGRNPSKVYEDTRIKYQNKQAAREQIKVIMDYFPFSKIDSSKTTVLVTAGATQSGKTEKLLRAIAAEQKTDINLVDKYQFFVITGRNMKYFEKLVGLSKKYRYWSNIFPFPWVDSDVYALIQYASDFPILGSIAPATLNELIESECGPFIIYRTRAGQEIPHRVFVEEKGLGKFIPDLKVLVKKLSNGISDDERERFLNKGKAFRTEQAKLASGLSELVYNLYPQEGD